MSLATPVRRHYPLVLGSPPAVLHALLAQIPTDSGFWDARPDPARFSPREVLAHLADWSDIFDQRISLTLAEDHPTLPRINEERLPIDHHYASQDPLASLGRYGETRAAFIAKVGAMQDEDWERAAHREDMGDVTVTDLLILVAIHDGYHVRQLAELVEIWRSI